MKRHYINTALLCAAFLCTVSCTLFTYDNYEAPAETLKGQVVDRSGNPVRTDQASEGIRVRLIETSWEGNVTPQDFYCKPDGTFQNTKLFEADYSIRVDGPFVPIVLEDPDGEVYEDGSVNLHLKGTEEITFTVDPFLDVELLDASVSNGKITAKVRVSRGISRSALKEKMDPTGDWEESYANVTDVQLFVGYSSFMGYCNRDDRWSNKLEYSGSSFDENLDKVISISSIGMVPSGRKVFIRAAARINYDTPRGTGTRRWNYSESLEVNVP